MTPPKLMARFNLREAEIILAQAFRGSGAAWWWAQCVTQAAGREAAASTALVSSPAQAYLNILAIEATSEILCSAKPTNPGLA